MPIDMLNPHDAPSYLYVDPIRQQLVCHTSRDGPTNVTSDQINWTLPQHSHVNRQTTRQLAFSYSENEDLELFTGADTTSLRYLKSVEEDTQSILGERWNVSSEDVLKLLVRSHSYLHIKAKEMIPYRRMRTTGARSMPDRILKGRDDSNP